MKHRIITVSAISLVCLFTLLCGISLAGPTGIVDSKHDLSSDWGGSNFEFETLQRCVFCHTPHSAGTSYQSGTYWNSSGYQQSGSPILLWNRAIPNATSYETYSSSTTQGNMGDVRVYSLMCLSCHDGIQSMNVLQNPPSDMIDVAPADGNPDALGENHFGNPGFRSIPAVASLNIGERWDDTDTGMTELRNDHPISFDYSIAEGVDSGLYTATPGGSTGRYVGDTRVRLFPNPSGTVDSMECSTCHDVHNEGSQLVGGTYPFLVMSNDGSALCLNCHNK